MLTRIPQPPSLSHKKNNAYGSKDIAAHPQNNTEINQLCIFLIESVCVCVNYTGFFKSVKSYL